MPLAEVPIYTIGDEESTRPLYTEAPFECPLVKRITEARVPPAPNAGLHRVRAVVAKTSGKTKSDLNNFTLEWEGGGELRFLGGKLVQQVCGRPLSGSFLGGYGAVMAEKIRARTSWVYIERSDDTDLPPAFAIFTRMG